MTQFIARVNGKNVPYNTEATFVVEERRGRKYGVVASRESIEAALGKFARMERQGKRVRLMQVFQGRVKRLIAGG
jgi:hypothetical protein